MNGKRSIPPRKVFARFDLSERDEDLMSQVQRFLAQIDGTEPGLLHLGDGAGDEPASDFDHDPSVQDFRDPPSGSDPDA